MLVDVAHRFCIYPNAGQEGILNKAFGCCRFLWNRMLAEHNDVLARLKDDKDALYGYKYKAEKQCKQEFAFLKERNIKIIKSSTVGTTGSHVSEDRVRPVTTRAVVDERRILPL